jgi:hypothetical protein
MVLIPPGTLHASYRFLLDGDPDHQVVTCGHLWDSSSKPSLQTAANDLEVEMRVVGWGVSGSTSLTFVDVQVVGRRQEGGELRRAVALSGSVGTNAQPMPPSNLALLVHKVTDLAGRRNRGRWYFPAQVQEAEVNLRGELTAAMIADQQARANAWFNGVLAVNHTPVVLHSSGDDQPAIIDHLTVDPIMGTQRRRMR